MEKKELITKILNSNLTVEEKAEVLAQGGFSGAGGTGSGGEAAPTFDIDNIKGGMSAADQRAAARAIVQAMKDCGM